MPTAKDIVDAIRGVLATRTVLDAGGRGDAKARPHHPMGAIITAMTAPGDASRDQSCAPVAASRLRGGPQRALFGNPVRAFSIEELTGTVRRLDGRDPGQPVARLTQDVLTELAIEPTRRAREVVTESIRLARLRARTHLGDVTAAAWQAGSDEVRAWARAARYDVDDEAAIPGPVITAYNQAHPERPY